MKNLYKIQDDLYIIDNNEKITQNGIWARCEFTGDILKNRNGQYAYKVILTTNKLLIKDGVQAIPDEFLEWFVKNPSCEEVEVINEIQSYKSNRSEKWIYEYKIIIPKEEPKPFKQMEKLTEVDWEKFKKAPFPSKKEPKKIFDLLIATNLGNALTETMKSVSQHEGGIKQGEINLPNFKEEVCTCTDECLGYLTKSCKRIEEPKQETLEEFVFKVPFNYNIKPKEVIDMCMKEQENIILTWRLGHFIDMINSLPDDTEKNRILKSVFNNRQGELLLESYKSMKLHYEK